MFTRPTYSFDSIDLSGIILNPIQSIEIYKNHNQHQRRINKFFLTEEYNEDYFKKVIEHMKISQFSIMKDDIKNYNKLTEFQIDYLINLNEDEKIEIIKIYNNMIETIEYLHN
jgi:hypothetical protein